MMLFPVFLALPLTIFAFDDYLTTGGKATTDCPAVKATECDWEAGEVSCYGGHYNGCEMQGYCMSSYGDCPAVCGTYCDYNAGEMYCDNGFDTNNCWMGGYCESSWGDCPATCKANCNYEAGEQSCDNGVDDNGCWMGNHCAMECPVVCPPMTHVTCSTDELVCGGGLDSNGCEMPEICMPMKSGTGDDGQDCWSTCPVTCDYDDGQIYCDGGFYNGCAAGGYCAYSYGDCPAMCYANCDYNAGEMWCDNGLDENGCSMGDYCSTTGCYATTATGTTATGTTATGTTAPGTTGPAAQREFHLDILNTFLR